MPFHHLTLTQNLPFATSIGAAAGVAGSWTGTIYFAIASIYSDDSIERLETIGLNPTRTSAVATAGAVTSKKIDLTWTAPSPLPSYYRAYYTTSAVDWATTLWTPFDAIIPASATSVTLDGPDDGGTELLFGSSSLSVVLNPIINWKGQSRNMIVPTITGVHRQKSWVKPTVYISHKFEMTTMSCPDTDYRILQRWMRFATPIKIDEPTSYMTDHMPLFSSIYGSITALDEVYSWGKVNADNWEMEFLVQSETLV